MRGLPRARWVFLVGILASIVALLLPQPLMAQSGQRASDQPTPPTTIVPFLLRGVVIEGASLPQATLAGAWQPYLGATVDSGLLVRVSRAVIAVYEASDVAIYKVVVPGQSFDGGVLRIQVVEGYLEAVGVGQDAPRRDAARVERRLASLTRQRPLSKRDFQRAVSLLRDTPGLNATLELVPGAAPGAARLSVRLAPRPVQFSIGVNNRGTAYLGRTQATADLYLNGLLVPEGQTRFTLIAPTEQDRFRYYGVSHRQRVDAAGTEVQIYAAYLRTRPLGPALIGHATSLGVQVSRPLQRSFTRDLYFTAALDAVDSDNAFLGRTFSDDAVRSLRAGATVKTTGQRAAFTGSMIASIGLDALGARTLDPLATNLNFTKLSGAVGYNRSVGLRAVLRLNAAGQWTNDHLPASEHFTLGGRDFGRAYAAAALSGDRGYGASAELALKVPASHLEGAELYTFVDGGALSYLGRAGRRTEGAQLSSAGLGARGAFGRRVGVELEASRGLANDEPALKSTWRGVFTLRTVW